MLIFFAVPFALAADETLGARAAGSLSVRISNELTSLFSFELSLSRKLLAAIASVAGHGRLMDPPARNSMWRFGYPNAVNYDDNELFCGGYAVQWEQNEGKCGVCGDAYQLESPRPHEAGGLYAKGIITRFYSSGQVGIRFGARLRWRARRVRAIRANLSPSRPAVSA